MKANLNGRGCAATHKATQALQEGGILPRQPLPVGGLSSALRGRARLHALQSFLDMHGDQGAAHAAVLYKT